MVLIFLYIYNFTGSGKPDCLSVISRPSAVSNGLFHRFFGVGTDGSGNITIQVTDGNGSNLIINGILIEAIPEPSTLTALGLLSVGLLRRWKR